MYSGVKYASPLFLDVASAEDDIEVIDETDDKLPQSASFPDETPDEKRRADWRTNHLLIENAIMLLMRMNGRPATNVEIAEKTGLSERAVRYHLENVNLNELFKDIVINYAPLADEIMMSVVKSARNGTSKAQELYFEIVFGWKRGQKIEIEQPEYSREQLEKLKNDVFRRHDDKVQALLALSPDALYAQVHDNKDALMMTFKAAKVETS